MAATAQTQAVVQKAATVVAPMTLGFIDCVALLLSFLLMLMSAFAPDGAREEE